MKHGQHGCIMLHLAAVVDVNEPFLVPRMPSIEPITQWQNEGA